MAPCPNCSAPLEDDELCMACMLAGGLATEAAPTMSGEAAEVLPVRPRRADEAELSFDSFGPYSIVRALGEGGMGVVYLAEQTAPIRRQVALKVIKLGMDTGAILSRFMYERQALAMMDHPNIARVYDASSTAKGRPYFVMEYIAGEPITTYCDRHRMNTRERLRLFVPVCQAVQHAHSKGILHRDIKPSNVLVMEVDGTAVPKVIDFGIAKATDQTQQEQTVFTEFGQFVGTPEYMSPEAADPVHNDVDTTSDVYSLGVLLYELLAGAVPFDGKMLRKAGLAELLRIIREDEAPPLTAKLTQLGKTVSAIAEKRSTNPLGLRNELAGDLNSIVMKAVEKRRARRYESVAELWNDVQRHLDDRPVKASPPSRVYRLQKFVRRNWAVVVGAAAVLAAVVIGVAATVWQAREATREREVAVRERALAVSAQGAAERERLRAESEAKRAVVQETLAKGNLADVERLAEKMLFELEDQVKDLGGSTAARKTLVALGLEYLKKTREDNPRLGAAYLRMAELQGLEGLFDVANARESCRQAIARLTGGDSESRRLLALAHLRMGQMEESEARQELDYATAERIVGKLVADEPRNVAAMHMLALILMEKKEGKKALELEERAAKAGGVGVEDKWMLGRAQFAMAEWAVERGGITEATQWAERAVKILEEVAAAAPGNARYRIFLAGRLARLVEFEREANRGAEAEAAGIRSLALAQEAAAADPENVRAQDQLADSMSTQVSVAFGKGRVEEVRAGVAKASKIRRALMEQYPGVLWLRVNFGAWLVDTHYSETAQWNYREGVTMLQEAERVLREAVRRHPESLVAKRQLYRCLRDMGIAARSSGNAAGARAMFMEAVAGERALGGANPKMEDTLALATALHYYADGLNGFGEKGEATRRVAEGVELLRRAGAAERGLKRPMMQYSLMNVALANVLSQQGAFADMRVRLETASPVLGKWVEEHPQDVEAASLYWSYQFYGRVYALRTGDDELLLRTSQLALDIAYRVLALDPKDINRRSRVASSLVNLSGDLQRIGQRETGLRKVEEGIAFLEGFPAEQISELNNRLQRLVSYAFFVRLLSGNFDEAARAIPYAHRVIAEAESVDKATGGTNVRAQAALETAYRDAAGAYLNAGNVAEARRMREKSMQVFLRRRLETPAGYRNRATYEVAIGNYEDRLGNAVEARAWRKKALTSLGKSVELAERRLGGPQGGTPQALLDLYHTLHMQASIREYLGDMEEARRLSKQALERISRVVEMEPNMTEHQSQLRAMRGRLYRLYALAGQGREDRRAEEVEGWVITAANMAHYGYRIGDRIAVLEKAVELSRGLAPGRAAELDLSRSLGTLCGALQTQAHFESGAAREAVLHRARAAGMEAKRRFEQLQREQRMEASDLNRLYANKGTLANVDSHLRAVEQAKSAHR